MRFLEGKKTAILLNETLGTFFFYLTLLYIYFYFLQLVSFIPEAIPVLLAMKTAAYLFILATFIASVTSRFVLRG